jgi:hypothetical protein
VSPTAATGTAPGPAAETETNHLVLEKAVDVERFELELPIA